MPPPLPVIAALVTAVLALVAVYRVRGSTAVPAAWWAAAACLALAADTAAQAAGAVPTPAAAARIRLGVSALAVCPAMALLGAKRPQHGVWQLIVATLAVVVAMPALSAWLVRPGSLPDVHLLGRAFLIILTVVGWLNFAATSHGLAATAIAAGQCLIMRPFLPGSVTATALPQPLCDATGSCLLAAGAVAALLCGGLFSFRGSRLAADSGPADRIGACIDPPFRALRDTLGAAWALRIAERFDTVAAERGWPCRLRFAGLEAGGDPADDSWHRDALRGFKALAHRFADDRWLARHGWPHSLP